jgi:hypothetical protein
MTHRAWIRAWVASAIVLATCAAATVARGQGIAVESHVGDRPEDASDALRGLFAALAKHGATGGDALRERVERTISQPAAQVTADHLVTAARLVDQAEKMVVEGRHAEALRMLPAAIDVYAAQTAAVAASADLRAIARRAHIALTVAHIAVGNDTDARAAAAALLRGFPEQPIAEATVEKLVASLRPSATGSAKIDASDAGADLFLDERKIGTGSATATSLMPGTYRVHAQRQGVAGRVHLLEVKAGATASLKLDWALDSALQTRKDFVGFVFPSDADRLAHEATLARSLARTLGAREVVFVGIRVEDGVRSIVAATLDVDSGKPLLAAAAAIEPLSTLEARAAGIADYLAGKPASAGVVPLGEVKGAGKTTAVVIDPAKRPVSRLPIYQWTAIGLGTAALAGGIYLLLLDGEGSCSKEPSQTQCPEVYDTKLAGIGTAVGGAALVGAGVYLWLRGDGGSRERRGIGLTPTRSGAAVTFSGRF